MLKNKKEISCCYRRDLKRVMIYKRDPRRKIMDCGESWLICLYIPPQAQGGIGPIQSSPRSGRNLGLLKDYVKWLAIWLSPEIGASLITPRATCSRTKWTSISICLVRWWETRFFAMLTALVLSQCSIGRNRVAKTLEQIDIPHELSCGDQSNG